MGTDAPWPFGRHPEPVPADQRADEDRDDSWAWIDTTSDPLERVCQQLNFEHSLVLDADELRKHVLTALDHVTATRVRNIAVFERCAANSSGERSARLLALARASRRYRDAARRRAAGAMALPIDEPRPYPT